MFNRFRAAALAVSVLAAGAATVAVPAVASAEGTATQCTYNGPAVCQGSFLNPDGGTTPADRAATTAINEIAYYVRAQFPVTQNVTYRDPDVQVVAPNAAGLALGINRAAWGIEVARVGPNYVVTVGIPGATCANQLVYGYFGVQYNPVGYTQEGCATFNFTMLGNGHTIGGTIREDGGYLPTLTFSGYYPAGLIPAYNALVAVGV